MPNIMSIVKKAGLTLTQIITALDPRYAKLDGTNQPFTGDVEVRKALAQEIINDIANDTHGTGGDTVSTIVVGGAVVTPVFYDGTNWVAH